MNAVHQKITRRIQGIEMKVRDFAEEIKNAKKEAKREKKPVAEYIAEEEEKSEAKDNNEKKPFMMGGRPTSIDMSKLNQCRPGYGFHIKGVKKCVKDPQERREISQTRR